MWISIRPCRRTLYERGQDHNQNHNQGPTLTSTGFERSSSSNPGFASASTQASQQADP